MIGKHDDRVGEEVVAHVALKAGCRATTDELIAHCKERLAVYKYPRSIAIVAELPKGPTGKILKRSSAPERRLGQRSPQPHSQGRQLGCATTISETVGAAKGADDALAVSALQR